MFEKLFYIRSGHGRRDGSYVGHAALFSEGQRLQDHPFLLEDRLRCSWAHGGCWDSFPQCPSYPDDHLDLLLAFLHPSPSPSPCQDECRRQIQRCLGLPTSWGSFHPSHPSSRDSYPHLTSGTSVCIGLPMLEDRRVYSRQLGYCCRHFVG